MRLSHKKRLTCLVIGTSTCLFGIEYAVILPSAWGYLQDRFPDIHPAMLGSLLASFNLGALLAGPLACWWSWVYRNTRAILLTLNIFSLTGAVFYLCAPSPWALLASRFVSGLGFGCQSALVVDVSRSLTNEGTGRRAIFLLYLSRQLGLLLGPALYLPLESLPYPTSQSRSYLIDKFSSPGLLLAIAFFLQELFYLFGYHNLTILREEERLREQVFFSYHRFSTADTSLRGKRGGLRRTSSLPHYIWSSVVTPTLTLARAAGLRDRGTYNNLSEDVVDNLLHVDNESDVAIESAEHFIMSASLSQSLPNNTQRNGQYPRSEGHISQKSENQSLLQMTDRLLISESSVCFDSISKCDRLKAYLQDLSDEYLRNDTLVLLAVIFTSVTSQKIFETIVTLFTKEIYMDTVRLNSFVFILIGFQLFLVAVFAQLVRRYIMDRVLLLLGLVLLSAALLCLLLVMPHIQTYDLSLVPYMVASGITCFMTGPLLVLCSSSLLVNITAFDKQIMTQELSQLFVSLGSVLGCLWGGAIWGHPYVLLGVPLGTVLFITVLYVLSFRHMISSGSSEGSLFTDYPGLRATADTPEEQRPILS